MTVVNTKINVLSAGAVQPGVAKIIEAFKRATAHDAKISFATAPAILKRISDANLPDVVIAPPAVLKEWTKAGKMIATGRVIVGRIGVGVMVRDGAPQPKIATVDEFKRSLLHSESIVYNQASTGIYLEKLSSDSESGNNWKRRRRVTRMPRPCSTMSARARATKSDLAQPPSSSSTKAKGSISLARCRQKSKIIRFTPPMSSVRARPRRRRGRFIRYLTSHAAKETLRAAGIE